jgi:hypothetical protein
MRMHFISSEAARRVNLPVDCDSKPNQVKSALLQRCGVAQPVRAPGWRNGEIWDQNWALSEPSGEFRPVPQISSTAHAHREAGRCSVGLPHTVAAACGARTKVTKAAKRQTDRQTDRQTEYYKINSKLSNIHVGKLPKKSPNAQFKAQNPHPHARCALANARVGLRLPGRWLGGGIFSRRGLGCAGRAPV